MRDNLLAKNPEASEEELERIKTIKMDRSLRRHYDTVVHCSCPNHYLQFYKPKRAPEWWTYPYERNNGFLGRFNHNGHSGGELEELRFEGIKNPAPEDINSLEVLRSYLKGGTSERKGTLQNYIPVGAIEFPKFSQSQILRQRGPGFYNFNSWLMLHWSHIPPSTVSLVMFKLSPIFGFSGVGTARERNTEANLNLPIRNQGHIGIRVWKAEAGSMEGIPLERLTGHFILASLTIREEDLWVTIAHDHDATEVDAPFMEDDVD
ncbi:hypothetical protein K438DRAFT_1783568 [Mycena galopus ATCC 62051]|nr:hypothetical protein K438DRAFT_1783568 [Mycena galopus ATCC 62051]